MNKELNCAKSRGHKNSQSYTVSLATHFANQAKGSASPLQGLSKSMETQGWPKAGIALSLSERILLWKERVWDQVSFLHFHSPWRHSSVPQIGVTEHNPRNALRFHPWLDQTKNNVGQELTLFLVNHWGPHQLAPEKYTWHLTDRLWLSRWWNGPKRITSHRLSKWQCPSQLP